MTVRFAGDAQTVDALIRGGASVLSKTRGPQKLTALHLAAMGGHAEIVRLLKASGPDSGSGSDSISGRFLVPVPIRIPVP